MADEKVVELKLVEGEELASVIWDLAATGSVLATRRRFKTKFEKNISARQIRVIQRKYADQIKRKREDLNSPEALKECAALKKRAWAELLFDIAESALEPEFVGVSKFKDEETGEEITKQIYRVDRQSALAALRELKNVVTDFEDLAIKKAKLKPDDGGEEDSYEVDDGVA